MTCCFTGHRKFPWGDNQDDPRHKDLIQRLENAGDKAIADGATHFICGNAVGVDTWAAEIVLKKKAEYPNIFLEIALPFAGHNAHIAECTAVQRKADLVHVVGKSKGIRSSYFEQNHYMVDHSHRLIAVLSEAHRRSGSAETSDYAKRRGLKCEIIKFENAVCKNEALPAFLREFRNTYCHTMEKTEAVTVFG